MNHYSPEMNETMDESEPSLTFRHPSDTAKVKHYIIQARIQAQQDLDQLCIDTIRTLAMDAATGPLRPPVALVLTRHALPTLDRTR